MKGWIERRTAADGSLKYDAKWRTPEGIKRSKTFDKEKAAEKYLATQVVAVHSGTYTDVQPVPMSTVFEKWLEHVVAVRLAENTMRPSTAKAYKAMVHVHLAPRFGTIRSDKLSHTVMETWRSEMASKIKAGAIAPKYLGNLRGCLSSIIAWALHPSRRYLSVNPMAGLPALRVPRTSTRPHYEPDQVRELLKHLAPPHDTIARLTMLTGLRRGEVFGLQWGDVDSDNGQLHVRRSLYQGAVSLPKTAGSERVVDVPRRLLDDLEVYRLLHPPLAGDYVFRQANGKPLDPDAWHMDHLVPALTKAGLRLPGSGLHALRHSYVSLLAAQGEDAHYIARQVGHSNVKLTQDIYRHVFSATRAAAMRRLDAVADSIGQPSGKARRTGRTQR